MTDTDRLEYLEKQEYCNMDRMGTSVPYWIVQAHHVTGVGPTLREAIDSAMKLEKHEEE